MALRWPSGDGMGLSPPSSTVVALAYGMIDPMLWEGAPHVPLSLCPYASLFPHPLVPMFSFPHIPISSCP